MRVTVHVLRHGRTLCLSVHGLPCNWGPQHKWVGFQDPAAPTQATCPTCREALALIPHEVLDGAQSRAVHQRP
jgi:hypothetical protein